MNPNPEYFLDGEGVVSVSLLACVHVCVFFFVFFFWGGGGGMNTKAVICFIHNKLSRFHNFFYRTVKSHEMFLTVLKIESIAA